MLNISVAVFSFLILLFMGLPVFFSLGVSSVIYCFFSGEMQYLFMIGNKFYSGMDNFVLMAIPLYILAGEIINRGGITERLVSFAEMIVGRVRGGLAYVTVLSTMFFAGITGSALSEVAALGSILVPAMEKNGYDRKYATALMAASAIQGPIIPPSIPAVLIAAVTGTSTGALFLGGAIPGVILGFFCCVITFFISKKRNYPKNEKKFLFREMIVLAFHSFFPLLTPFIIIGGLMFGIFTPTEAAGVAVVYSILISIIGLKSMKRKDISEILTTTVISTAKIYLIIGAATVFAWILAIENIPAYIAGFLNTVTSNKYVLLFIINVFLLFWGMFMDTAPTIMIVVPLLYPIAEKFGIHPVHFGVVIIVNLMIGLLTPPFGMVLFSAQAIGKVSLKDLLRELFPFLVADFIMLMLITYVPEITLFIPRYFGLL